MLLCCGFVQTNPTVYAINMYSIFVTQFFSYNTFIQSKKYIIE
jgi:hypothetical protein